MKTKVKLVIIASLFVACNLGNDYPTIIIEKKLTEEYDFSKWYLYSLYCNSECTERFSQRSKYLAFYDLAFSKVEFFGKDTIELTFKFMIDSVPCMSSSLNQDIFDDPMIGTIGFVNKRFCYLKPLGCENITFSEFNDPKKLNPSDSEAINFIKTHKNEINTWLYNEAKKRHVIE